MNRDCTDHTTEFGRFISFETLTLCPIDLDLIDMKMLTEDEKVWINSYHTKVKGKLSPFLPEKTVAFLDYQTREI